MDNYLKDLGKVTLTMNGVWENKPYERLCVVNYNGATYISRKYVPADKGIIPTNIKYWQPFIYSLIIE